MNQTFSKERLAYDVFEKKMLFLLCFLLDLSMVNVVCY
jgi:predicted membrane chloride channel (bestrophin family)